MGIIRLLQPSVAEKIAAGEVIDSVASVVKELVENSLDANAKRIIINLKNNGLSLIEVVDDGSGMDESDLRKSVKKHTTSKIQFEKDLVSVKSFGFRGEALFSIASVSDLEMKSRHKDSDSGYLLSNVAPDTPNKTNGGLRKKWVTSPIGMPVGTVVSVRNLFEDLPARKKFEEGDRKALNNVISVVSRIALVNSGVGFKLTNDEKVLLDIYATNDWKSRMAEIFGKRTAGMLIEVSHHENGYALRGFIGRPQLFTTSREKQLVFVNGRMVDGMSISQVVKKTYGTLLETHVYPVLILDLLLPHEHVDVNVHPRKTEVLLADELRVMSFVKSAVSLALSRNDLTYLKEGYGESRAMLLKDKGAGYFYDEVRNFDLTCGASGEIVLPVSSKVSQKDKLVLIVGKLYLIVEAENGFDIYDQHAAHERVVYEHLYESYSSEFTNKSVDLQPAVLLNLGIGDSQLLSDFLDQFVRMGFGIEPFGENTFKVDRIPHILLDRDIEGVILEVLEDLAHFGSFDSIDSRAEKALSYMACRSAIKGGHELSQIEALNLIQMVDNCKNQHTCPHGRPVKVHISEKELSKWFKRTPQ